MRVPRAGNRRSCPCTSSQAQVYAKSHRCKVVATAKGLRRGQEEGEEVVEELFHIDKGWTTDEFRDVAAQLQASLATPRDRSADRKDETAAASTSLRPDGGSPSDLSDSADDADFTLEELLGQSPGRTQLLYSTEGEWQVSSWYDDDEDGDSKGAGAAAGAGSDGWSVEAVEGEGWSVDAMDLDDDDSSDEEWSVEVLDGEDAGAALDESSTQMSSQQLLKDWAADKPADMSSVKLEDKADGRLDSLRPHDLKRINAEQAEAYELEKMFTPAEQKKLRKAKQRHVQLKLISGSAAGKRLFSPADERTRPMMEKVRGALFSMLLAQSAGSNQFPAGMRWLDMYAGTGAVGLESLSRGCAQAHFVEYDPWVIKKCLDPNVKTAGFQSQAVVHRMKAEDFMRRAIAAPGFAGKPFDFISVTPPYMLVSYPEIYELLGQSPLLHDRSIVIVEYAKQNVRDIQASLGPLTLVKDRRYGRTFLAIYANPAVAAV